MSGKLFDTKRILKYIREHRKFSEYMACCYFFTPLFVLSGPTFVYEAGTTLSYRFVIYFSASLFLINVYYGIEITVQKILKEKFSNFKLRDNFGLEILFMIFMMFLATYITISAREYFLAPDLDAVIYDRFTFPQALHYYFIFCVWTVFDTKIVFFALNLSQKAAELTLIEARNAEERAKSLSAQVNPHFLFNSLNHLSGLMYKDVTKANHLLQQITGFYRNLTLAISYPLIPLAQELELSEKYLEVEKFRFGGKFDFRFEKIDLNSSLFVPPVVLQPLLENAIKHGILEGGGEGMIVVRAVQKNRKLVLEVEDNGVGFGKSGNVGGTQTSLAILKQRLGNLPQGSGSVQSIPQEKGTLIRIELPLIEKE